MKRFISECPASCTLLLGSLIGILFATFQVSLTLRKFIGISPAYSIGTCVARAYKPQADEPWDQKVSGIHYRFSRKIIQVGNEKYLAVYWKGEDGALSLIGESDPEDMIWLDTEWFKIDCDTLERVE
jgi:hypothetical protein